MREFLNDKSEKAYLFTKNTLGEAINHLEDIKKLADKSNKFYLRKAMNCIAFGVGDTSYVFTIDPNYVYLVIDSNSKMDKESVSKEYLLANLSNIENIISKWRLKQSQV